MTSALSLLRLAATVISAVATAYVAGAYLLRFVMLLMAWRETRRQARHRSVEFPEAVISSGRIPKITVVVPAYNEEGSICRTISSLLAQAYTAIEVIVVSDGSTDTTLRAIADAFDIWPCADVPEGRIPTQNVRMVYASHKDPRLKVIDKRNGGKADALNVGINYSSGSLVCVIDADVVIDKWGLYYLALPFIEDDATVATSGSIRLHNGCTMDMAGVREARLPRRFVERMQVLEYTLAFGIGRLFFNYGDAHVVISGAFGLFRRDLVLEIGGFHPNAIGEDMEIVVRMHRHLRDRGRRYRMRFVSDAICYTEAPTTLTELGKQRTRWHQGLLTTLRVHRGMIGRPRYGPAGLFSLPYFLIFELYGPLVEAAGWLIVMAGLLFRFIDPIYTFTFVGVVLLLGTSVSWAGLFLDDSLSAYYPRFGQVLALAAYAVAEHFGYHQAMLYYRLRAFPRYYRGVHIKGGWVSPQRQSGTAAMTTR